MEDVVTVKQAEALLLRSKRYESAYYRLLKAAEDFEVFGYKVTLVMDKEPSPALPVPDLPPTPEENPIMVVQN
jgi:hypothetical protein